MHERIASFYANYTWMRIMLDAPDTDNASAVLVFPPGAARRRIYTPISLPMNIRRTNERRYN